MCFFSLAHKSKMKIYNLPSEPCVPAGKGEERVDCPKTPIQSHIRCVAPLGTCEHLDRFLCGGESKFLFCFYFFLSPLGPRFFFLVGVMRFSTHRRGRILHTHTHTHKKTTNKHHLGRVSRHRCCIAALENQRPRSGYAPKLKRSTPPHPCHQSFRISFMGGTAAHAGSDFPAMLFCQGFSGSCDRAGSSVRAPHGAALFRAVMYY